MCKHQLVSPYTFYTGSTFLVCFLLLRLLMHPVLAGIRIFWFNSFNILYFIKIYFLGSQLYIVSHKKYRRNAFLPATKKNAGNEYATQWILYSEFKKIEMLFSILYIFYLNSIFILFFSDKSSFFIRINHQSEKFFLNWKWNGMY